MYESYWGLERKPFDNTTDSKFYYPSESHQAALLKLRYVAENARQAALLTGAPGLGKSLLVQTLFRMLPDHVWPRVHVVFPQMPTDQLLAYLAQELAGERSDNAPASVEEAVRRIQDTLAELARDGKHALVVLDESHLIADNKTLETLRLLLNFEYEGKHAMTLVFVGQPSLLPLLERHRDLEERLAVKCLLRALDEDATAAYTTHRLQEAGATREIFSDSGLAALHELSNGIPRQINRLCDLALLVGFADEKTLIDEDAIRAVLNELVSVAPE